MNCTNCLVTMTNTLAARVDKMITRYPNTSDIVTLEKKDSHFIFVYGTLKSGYDRGILLTEQDGAKYQGYASTKSDDYEMCNTPDGFPVVLKKPEGETIPGRIKGELWLVPTSVLFLLDVIEQNDFVYKRQKVEVVVRRGPGQNLEVLDVWMYCGKNTYWSRNPDKLIEMNCRSDNNGNYYIFTKEDQKKRVIMH